MYSHRISAAVLDSMDIGSLVSGLNTTILEHGYRTKRLAFDAGSSLIPAAAATAEAASEQEADEEEDLSQEHAALMRVNLWEAGFTLRPGWVVRSSHPDPQKKSVIFCLFSLITVCKRLRPVHSKTPWRQSSVKSSVRSIKRILKASFLPSLEGMTPISFVRVSPHGQFTPCLFDAI